MSEWLLGTWRACVSTLAVLAVMVTSFIGASPAVAAPPAVTSSALAAGAGAPSASADIAQAADLSRFNAGNIMSDAVFFNSGTMNETQVGSFIRSKVASCQRGYTCLRDFSQSTVAKPADAYCSGYAAASNESAARIIDKVAKSCGINPQVLLATLQKEQGLVTHTWPSDWRYRAAMGQGCPDTAACDTRYYGFQNQVYGAARQFKIYAEGKYFQWYAPGKTWDILFHPNRGCGASPVHVQNAATAGLYYYTPYQPNAAALRAGYGEGDGCSSYGNRNFYQYFTDWFGSTQSPGGDPFGYISNWTLTSKGVRIDGWAIDPDTRAAISVRIKSGETQLARVTADRSRADLAERYPLYGAAHAFSVEVPLAPGTQTVCVAANNVGEGANRTIGCRELATLGGDPYGEITEWTPTSTGIRVSGWVIDPDSVGAASIRVKTGQDVVARATANKTHAPLAVTHAAYGTAHGFSVDIPTGPGVQEVCIAMNNVGVGTNRTLVCRDAQSIGGDPFGRLDSWEQTVAGVKITGWVIDPDTVSATSVRVKSGSAQLARVTANVHRDDVAAAHPAYGGRHGFEIDVALPAGEQTVCVVMNNVGAGSNRTLECRELTRLSGDPIGAIDDWTQTATGVRVSGWVIDPDTVESVSLRIKSGSSLVGRATANLSRQDLSAYAQYGDAHGFVVEVPLPEGSQTVCVVMNNIGPGVNRTLGCRDLVQRSGDPFGAIDAWAETPEGIRVTGWVIDPDTADPISIRVKSGVDQLVRVTANLPRNDIAAGYPAYGAAHGFDVTVPLPSGDQTVCVAANNVGVGNNRTLGCTSLLR